MTPVKKPHKMIFERKTNMKKNFILLCLLLGACSVKEPSVAIMETAQKEVKAVQETVTRIEKQTPEACKTDAFMANFNIGKQSEFDERVWFVEPK